MSNHNYSQEYLDRMGMVLCPTCGEPAEVVRCNGGPPGIACMTNLCGTTKAGAEMGRKAAERINRAVLASLGINVEGGR